MKQQSPTLKEEEKLWSCGYDTVVGIDEVGRGPLAGPVVSGACFLESPSSKDLEKILKLGIKDSKKISEKKREAIFEEVKNFKFVKWGVGIVDEKTIDKINILEASLFAMKIAVENLNIKNIQNTFLLVDGRELVPNLSISQKAIISGDVKVFSIALASIMAKVTRDRMMQKYAKKYPEYSFQKHKGYGTKIHFEAIKKYGPCKIHRRSFLH
jgi:ribonuclease HII